MSSLSLMERHTSTNSSIDEALLLRIRDGEELALQELIEKYRKVVHRDGSNYFLLGSDKDDVIQEGLIGLYKAICDYDVDGSASFKSFAEICITRQIITSIKAATRKKHAPLNSYISFYRPISEGESERVLLETIIDEGTIEPIQRIVEKENYVYWTNHLMRALTGLEWNVLYYYLRGYSYEEIACKIGREEKSIDNALQRIKRKTMNFKGNYENMAGIDKR